MPRNGWESWSNEHAPPSCSQCICARVFSFRLAFRLARDRRRAASQEESRKEGGTKDNGESQAPDKTSDKTDEKEGKSSADKADPAKNEVGVKTRKGQRAKEKLFDFTALQLDGSTRMPQLLYFLERASEELQRASLKRRSFVPEMSAR